MMTEEKRELIDFINQEIDKWDDERRYVRVLEIALAALTQPASPALKLPDEVACDGFNPKEADEARGLGQCEGWNACIAETNRLNAPHTAPIEPICATGGAEWVKCSERMPRHRQSVLGWQEKPGTVIECYPEGIKWYYDYSDGPCGNITHWMPLPAAPEAE